MGVYDVGGDVLTVAHQAAKGTVVGAVEIGADVGAVANSVVRGVIEATRAWMTASEVKKCQSLLSISPSTW